MPHTLFTALVLFGASPTPEGAQEAAVDEVSKAFKSVELADEEFVSSSDVETLKTLGWDESKLLAVVEGLFAVCLAGNQQCNEAEISPKDRPRVQRGHAVLELLGAVGTPKVFSTLWRLQARGLWHAEHARLQIYERAMADAISNYSCEPPSPQQVAAIKKSLKDFVVIRPNGKSLKLDHPTGQETNDLAYFLAAVAEAGPEVGESPLTAASSMKRGTKNQVREDLSNKVDEEKLRGNVSEISETARSYLETLGFPGAIRAGEEAAYSWGGAKFSYIMRDLADVDEGQGNYAEAATLYRTANPGGGCCGTGVAAVWRDQVKGLIRSEEKAGHCRAIVPERLLSLGQPTMGDDPYDTERLRKAGFDIARLYRGALVTAYRDIDENEWTNLFSSGAAELNIKVMRRLKEKGPEDWERRISALEGWADIVKRQAIPRLTEIAVSRTASVRPGRFPLRRRALQALGELFRRPEIDPCKPDNGWISLFGPGINVGGPWHRGVHTLTKCGEVLTKAERDALSRQLLSLLQADDPYIKAEGANTLGAIASTVSIPSLSLLLKDEHHRGELCSSEEKGTSTCRPFYPAREAARDAIDRIRSFEKPKYNVRHPVP